MIAVQLVIGNIQIDGRDVCQAVQSNESRVIQNQQPLQRSKSAIPIHSKQSWTGLGLNRIESNAIQYKERARRIQWTAHQDASEPLHALLHAFCISSCHRPSSAVSYQEAASFLSSLHCPGSRPVSQSRCQRSRDTPSATPFFFVAFLTLSAEMMGSMDRFSVGCGTVRCDALGSWILIPVRWGSDLTWRTELQLDQDGSVSVMRTCCGCFFFQLGSMKLI